MTVHSWTSHLLFATCFIYINIYIEREKSISPISPNNTVFFSLCYSFSRRHIEVINVSS